MYKNPARTMESCLSTTDDTSRSVTGNDAVDERQQTHEEKEQTDPMSQEEESQDHLLLSTKASATNPTASTASTSTEDSTKTTAPPSSPAELPILAKHISNLKCPLGHELHSFLLYYYENNKGLTANDVTCYLCKKKTCMRSLYVCFSLDINICEFCFPYFHKICNLCKQIITGSFCGCRACDIDICERCIRQQRAPQSEIDSIKTTSSQLSFSSSVHLRSQEKDIIVLNYWLSKTNKNLFDLQQAPYHIRHNKGVVMAAVRKNGRSLQYAPEEFQHDKEVVVAAVKQCPDAIKYVHEDLKRDPQVLIAADLFDEHHDDVIVRQEISAVRKIAFSTRFSLDSTSNSEATNFTALFKNSEYIQNEGKFVIYAPNAFDKKTCDPDWTNFDWPCQGTKETCQYNNILTDTGHPTDSCCWRYSFRSQIQEAKDTGGFMLQLVETGAMYGNVDNASLGKGQAIEIEMAHSIGAKVFQVYRPTKLGKYESDFMARHIDVVTAEISKWYSNQCQDMSVTIIRPKWWF